MQEKESGLKLKIMVSLRKKSLSEIWNGKWRFLLAVLAILVIVQCSSLVGRAINNSTDFTVFFNTAKLLSSGAGAELYASHDQTTNWLRTIPPFGQMIFQPFALGNIQTAAIGWSLFNILLLGIGAQALLVIGENLDAKSRLFRAIAQPAICLLLWLSFGSLQVGQFSVLFAVCWLVFLAFATHSNAKIRRWSVAFLAIPAGIKLYPAFLFGILLIQKRFAAFGLAVLFFAATFAVPALFYGVRTPALTQSFFQCAIFSSDSRVKESQNADSLGNQGIDAVFLRFGAANLSIQRKFPHFTHGSWPKNQVASLVSLVRLFVVLATFFVAWNSWKTLARSPRYGTLVLLALFCAALYLILPGAKSRYAIYLFPAFLPLLLQTLTVRKRCGQNAAFWIWSALIVILALLCVQFMPRAFRLYGLGFGAHLTLWILNLWLIWRAAPEKLEKCRRTPMDGRSTVT